MVKSSIVDDILLVEGSITTFNSYTDKQIAHYEIKPSKETI